MLILTSTQLGNFKAESKSSKLICLETPGGAGADLEELAEEAKAMRDREEGLSRGQGYPGS